MTEPKPIKLEDEPENFRSDGKPFVVRCPRCHLENWGPAVASGMCAWCGWSEVIEAERRERGGNARPHGGREKGTA